MIQEEPELGELLSLKDTAQIRVVFTDFWSFTVWQTGHSAKEETVRTYKNFLYLILTMRSP